MPLSLPGDEYTRVRMHTSSMHCAIEVSDPWDFPGVRYGRNILLWSQGIWPPASEICQSNCMSFCHFFPFSKDTNRRKKLLHLCKNRDRVAVLLAWVEHDSHYEHRSAMTRLFSLKAHAGVGDATCHGRDNNRIRVFLIAKFFFLRNQDCREGKLWTLLALRCLASRRHPMLFIYTKYLICIFSS